MKEDSDSMCFHIPLSRMPSVMLRGAWCVTEDLDAACSSCNLTLIITIIPAIVVVVVVVRQRGRRQGGTCMAPSGIFMTLPEAMGMWRWPSVFTGCSVGPSDASLMRRS